MAERSRQGAEWVMLISGPPDHCRKLLILYLPLRRRTLRSTASSHEYSRRKARGVSRYRSSKVSNAARCPPAEWPLTKMRFVSPPNSAACWTVHAKAAATSSIWDGCGFFAGKPITWNDDQNAFPRELAAKCGIKRAISRAPGASVDEK